MNPILDHLSPSSITPYGNNPRRNEAAVDAVAASITEFGFQSPIIVDREGVIIAGHTRHKAALKLGLDTVPVIVANLTPDKARALRLVDNRVGELAEWDADMLLAELEVLSMEGIDLSEFDFELPGEETGAPGSADLLKPGEDKYQQQYGVTVVCADEAEQEAVYTRLLAEGLTVKVVTV